MVNYPFVKSMFKINKKYRLYDEYIYVIYFFLTSENIILKKLRTEENKEPEPSNFTYLFIMGERGPPGACL